MYNYAYNNPKSMNISVVFRDTIIVLLTLLTSWLVVFNVPSTARSFRDGTQQERTYHMPAVQSIFLDKILFK